MSIKAILVICWWAAFLIGCIITYVRYRIEKKRLDDEFCEILKRHMYTSKD